MIKNENNMRDRKIYRQYVPKRPEVTYTEEYITYLKATLC